MAQDNSIRFASVSAVVTALTGNSPNVGDYIRDPSTNADYVFAYNTGNSEIPPAVGVVLAETASGASVTLTSVTGVTPAFGVCQHATVPTGGYAWFMRRGFGKVTMQANSGCSSGKPLVLADNGKIAEKATSTGIVANVMAYSLSAIASGASGSAYINCG